MPRNIIKQEEVSTEVPGTDNLEDLVNQYFEANNKKKEAEKILKPNGDKIKAILKGLGKTEYKGEHTATIRTDESLDYDDVKLLAIVDTLPEEIKNSLIRTVRVVDVEAVERAIIAGTINVEQLSSAVVKKSTVKLFVK